jgi:hypothetical protein
LAYPLLWNRLGSAFAVGSLLVTCLAAGCFTDPINMSPTVRIDAPPDPIFRGVPVPYTATASDPDGDTVTLQWALKAKACPPDFQSQSLWPVDGWKPGNNGSNELDLGAADTTSTFCVWVKASDRYGAANVDARTGDPQDQAPVAALDLVSPADAQSFPLHTMFTLSAAATQDPDDPQSTLLPFAWSVTALSSPNVAFVPCPTPQPDTVRCLLADVADDYQVEVRVTDSAMKTSTARKTLHVVPGQPPVALVDLVAPTGSGPFPLGSTFQVSAARSTGDGTVLRYVWTASQSDGSAVPFQPCAGSSDPAVACFTAPTSGTYNVGLTVRNDAGKSASVSVSYMVAPDQPPCIDLTTPDFRDPVTTMTVFDVDSVSDDLDPYPSFKSMQWFVTDDAGAFVPRETGFPSLTLNPLGLSFGQNLRVRVEIHDRNTMESEAAFIACGDQDFCSLPSLIHPTTCFQRVTWTLNVLP